jgi:hypothetical protein
VDKVYGLLGLADDRDNYGAPDYSKSHMAVFAEVARAIVKDQGNLRLLDVAGIGDSLEGNTPGLSSWAPDWPTRRYNVGGPAWEWRVCGHLGHPKEYRFYLCRGF